MGKAVTFYIKDFRGRTVDDFIKYLQQLGMRVFLPPVNVCNKMLDTEGEVKIDIIFDEEKGQWISVKDRQPERDGFYLAWYTFKDGSHACDMFYYNGSFISSSITHWMPFPEPSESEDDAE